MRAMLRRFRRAAPLRPKRRAGAPAQHSLMRALRRPSIALLAGLAVMPLLAAAGSLAQWLHGAG
jgi:hypothetical protein